MLTFGPVPSRHLGRSLGINNIPPKACTYSCVYCQVGSTKTTKILIKLLFTYELDTGVISSASSILLFAR